MRENLEATRNFPEWYSSEKVDDFQRKLEHLHHLQREHEGFPMEVPVNDAAVDFLKDRPDARRLYAFHMLIGSTVDQTRMSQLKGFDYPDQAIQQLVSDLIDRLEG